MSVEKQNNFSVNFILFLNFIKRFYFTNFFDEL